MRTTQLGNSGISCTVLGFGCATLLGSSGKRESLRALAAAWDQVINLYDTARSYGGGESEALLGDFLVGRRHNAVIATKFGIVPLRPPLWKRIAKPAVRTAIAAFPSMRSVIHKQAVQQYENPPFTVSLLEESIHLSLRKLKTDYVDILFLHAPPASVLDQDDLLAAMEKLVDAGKVRAAGISADPDVIDLTLQRNPRSLNVLQFPCNLFNSAAPKLVELHQKTNSRASKFGALANSPFGGPLGVHRSREILTRVAALPGLDPVLREKLGSIDDAVLPDVVLNLILSHPSIHAVVSAMMQPRHLAKNVAAISNSRFTSQDIGAIRAGIAQISE